MKKSIVSKKMRETLQDLAAGKPVEEARHMSPKLYVLPVSPGEVKAARTHLHYSQGVFAAFLGVSLQTVQAWEQGRRTPEAVVSKVIRLATKDQGFVENFMEPALAGAMK